MSDKKKLYFFNDRFKDYPKWVVYAVSISTGLLITEMFERAAQEYLWVSYAIGLFFVFSVGYLIFQATRKNAYYWVRDHEFKFTINGVKLEVDVNFLSEYYVKDEVLHGSIQKVLE